MELGWRAGCAAPSATAGWERQDWWLLCCKPVVLIPVTACTIHWASLLRAETFQVSYLGKISKLTMDFLPPHHSAAFHSRLLCLQALTIQLEAAVVRSHSAGLASSVPVWYELGGWRKVFKTLEKTVFCWLPFQGSQELCSSQLPLPVIVDLVCRYETGEGERFFHDL